MAYLHSSCTCTCDTQSDDVQVDLSIDEIVDIANYAALGAESVDVDAELDDPRQLVPESSRLHG